MILTIYPKPSLVTRPYIRLSVTVQREDDARSAARLCTAEGGGDRYRRRRRQHVHHHSGLEDIPLSSERRGGAGEVG